MAPLHRKWHQVAQVFELSGVARGPQQGVRHSEVIVSAVAGGRDREKINKDGPFLRECSSLFINIVIHCSYSFFENMFHMFCFNIFFRIVHYLGLEMVREVFLL